MHTKEDWAGVVTGLRRRPNQDEAFKRLVWELEQAIEDEDFDEAWFLYSQLDEVGEKGA